MNSTAFSAPAGVLALGAQRVDAAEPQSEEHRVIGLGQVREVEIAAERLAVLGGNAADRGDVVDLGLGKIVGALVGGNAELVEAAGFRPRLEDRHVMSVARQPVSGGQSGRAGADHGDLPAGRLGTLVELLALLHRDVGGVALQPADLHRLALGDLAHADLLAQRLGRADARAHAAQDVLVEDGLGRAQRIAGGNLADEQRDVDRRRARVHAGRVVAEIAAVGFDQRLMMVERRMQVGKILRVFAGRQPASGDPLLELTFGHAESPLLVLPKG